MGTMEEYLSALIRPLLPLARLNPGERMRALRRGTTVGGEGAATDWTWVLVVLGAAAAVAILAWCVVYYRRTRSTGKWVAFGEQSDRLGLSEDERKILGRLARSAGLRRPEAIFSSEAAFNRGMIGGQTRNRPATALGEPPAGMCSNCVFVNALRQKLGFDVSGSKRGGTLIDLGPVVEGALLTAIRQGSIDEIEMTVVKLARDPLQLKVKSSLRLEARPGESWVVRCPGADILYEFNAWVTAVAGEEAIIKPFGQVRKINRRRFARVQADNPAYVARFAFEKSGLQAEPPKFVEATLIEMAGPGLRMVAPLAVQTGERVLVMLALDAKRTIEGVGIVRRASAGSEGQTDLAVELIDVGDSEIAKLTSRPGAEATGPGGPAPPDKDCERRGEGLRWTVPSKPQPQVLAFWGSSSGSSRRTWPTRARPDTSGVPRPSGRRCLSRSIRAWRPRPSR